MRRVYRVRSGVAVLYALDITVDIIVSHTFTVHSKKDIVPIKNDLCHVSGWCM